MVNFIKEQTFFNQHLVHIDFAFVINLQGSVYDFIFKLYDSMAKVIKSYHFKDCS